MSAAPLSSSAAPCHPSPTLNKLESCSAAHLSSSAAPCHPCPILNKLESCSAAPLLLSKAPCHPYPILTKLESCSAAPLLLSKAPFHPSPTKITLVLNPYPTLQEFYNNLKNNIVEYQKSKLNVPKCHNLEEKI